MTESPQALELYRQHISAQDKYTYFLLAAAGASIAFAIQKTEGAHLAWPLLTCGLAVLFWGLSFYFGCKNIIWVKASMYANYKLIQLQIGTHPQQPSHPQVIREAMSGVRLALDENIEKAAFYYRWQFRCLLLGAACFIVWHVHKLALNTAGA